MRAADVTCVCSCRICTTQPCVTVTGRCSCKQLASSLPWMRSSAWVICWLWGCTTMLTPAGKRSSDAALQPLSVVSCHQVHTCMCLSRYTSAKTLLWSSACSEIVDRAQKELNIEKQIKKIEDTWAVLALVFTPLADSDIMSLQVGYLATYAGCSIAYVATGDFPFQLLIPCVI